MTMVRHYNEMTPRETGDRKEYSKLMGKVLYISDLRNQNMEVKGEAFYSSISGRE